MKGNFHVRFLGECGRGNPPALTRQACLCRAVVGWPLLPEVWSLPGNVANLAASMPGDALESEDRVEHGKSVCGTASNREKQMMSDASRLVSPEAVAQWGAA